MQTVGEIKSNIENIQYYCKELKTVIEKQMTLDCDMCIDNGKNYDINSIRALNLAIAYEFAADIELKTNMIINNIEHAKSQDSKFLVEAKSDSDEETVFV